MALGPGTAMPRHAWTGSSGSQVILVLRLRIKVNTSLCSRRGGKEHHIHHCVTCDNFSQHFHFFSLGRQQVEWTAQWAGGLETAFLRLNGTPDATATIFGQLEIVQVEQPKKSCIRGSLATHKETMRECRGQVEDEWRANPPAAASLSLGSAKTPERCNGDGGADADTLTTTAAAAWACRRRRHR